jgi:hypothetical protein
MSGRDEPPSSNYVEMKLLEMNSRELDAEVGLKVAATKAVGLLSKIQSKMWSLKFSLMEILLQSPGNKRIRTNIRTKKLRSIGENSSIRVKRVVTGV